MATLTLSFLRPPTHPWKELFCLKSTQTFLYLGLEEGGWGEGWLKGDKGTSQTCQGLPQDPSSLPPALEIKRALFEQQKKATKSLLEQCFNCYKIPLIILGQEPDDTGMECSIHSHTFLPLKCIHLQGGESTQRYYCSLHFLARSPPNVGRSDGLAWLFPVQNTTTFFSLCSLACLQQELTQTPG